MSDYDSTKDTQEHIDSVRQRIRVLIDNLQRRADVHDASKLRSPEKEIFDVMTPKLRGLTYGSDEYKASLKEMGVALEHHYKNNSHHPEFYGYAECDICFERYPRDYDGRCVACGHGTFTLRPDVSKMSLFDILEMLADWNAACMRHADGDYNESLRINKVRFNISDELHQIIMQTVKEIGWIRK